MSHRTGCACDVWLEGSEWLTMCEQEMLMRYGTERDGMITHPAQPRNIQFKFCPWCGSKLEHIVVFDDRFPVIEYEPNKLEWDFDN